MSEKIADRHRARKAILYIRQSSAYQVTHNEESRRLQYAMTERLRDTGWQTVDVIDEDLGRSAAGAVERTGFQRMVAEVCLGRVGVVAAREVSRFARNSRDWQQLIEVCRMVDTLLMDQEMVYDARQGNDRLLLGLKGSLNEYELDLLRQRSWEARQAKARRGELVVAAPVGFRKTQDQRIEIDPDLRVQQAIRLVFAKFLEVGSVLQSLKWFLEMDLQLPATRVGGTGPETVWKRPSYHTLNAILANPTYAGAYAYGKTATGTVVEDGRLHKTRAQKPMKSWSVLLPDRHDGYITWAEFLRIREMIASNAQGWSETSSGAPKRGLGLVVGLLRCRRCARKLLIRYTGNSYNIARYVCYRGHLDQGEPPCISFGGIAVDEAVSRELLRVVQPGAVEAAALACQHHAKDDDRVVAALESERQAARYEAERAQRQFDAADPDNRLVVDELERRWNLALQRVAEVEGRLAAVRETRQSISPPDLAQMKNLAEDFERIWNHPETDVRLKKRLVRLLIEEIVVDIDTEAAEVVLLVHWKGGVHTELRVRRRHRGQNGAHTPPDVVQAVRALATVCADDVIAGCLTRSGLRTAKGNRWIRERVTSLRSHYDIPVYSEEQRSLEGLMNLAEAAAYLGVSAKTLRVLAQRTLVPAQHPLHNGPWIFRRRELDDPKVRSHVPRGGGSGIDPAGHDPNQLSLEFPTT